MSDFAKLLRIDGQQVLVYIGIPTDEGSDVAIHTVFELEDGIQADLVVNGTVPEGTSNETLLKDVTEEKVAAVVRAVKGDFEAGQFQSDERRAVIES